MYTIQGIVCESYSNNSKRNFWAIGSNYKNKTCILIKIQKIANGIRK